MIYLLCRMWSQYDVDSGAVPEPMEASLAKEAIEAKCIRLNSAIREGKGAWDKCYFGSWPPKAVYVHIAKLVHEAGDLDYVAQSSVDGYRLYEVKLV